VRDWLERVGVDTLFITPGSPWENGYIESFNGNTLGEAKILIERWRQEYNTFRPHSALGYRPPAPEAVLVERRLVAGPLRDGSRPTRHCRRPPV
jgi:transposase InsO family protein